MDNQNKHLLSIVRIKRDKDRYLQNCDLLLVLIACLKSCVLNLGLECVGNGLFDTKRRG